MCTYTCTCVSMSVQLCECVYMHLCVYVCAAVCAPTRVCKQLPGNQSFDKLISSHQKGGGVSR